MSDNGFGTPKHTSDRKTFPEGPKEGSTEIRILPPILNQRESGKYVQDHTCHYGYGTKLQNSDKERPNPFYCVEQGKWVAGKFVTTQECPECQAIKLVKSQKERIEAQMKSEGKTDAEVAETTKSLVAWLKKHNRDFKQYVNVKDAAGRFFTMKLPQKDVWKPIKKHVEEFKARRIPIDAIAAAQGLWFRINRSGKGFKTEYSVEVVTEDVIMNGQVVEGASKPKFGPLTAEDAKKASEACMDIGDVGIRRLSIEQVQRLVASKGDQSIVQAIFEGSDPSSQAHGSVDVEESPEDIAAGPVAAPAPTPAPAPVAAVAPVVTAPAAPTTQEDAVAAARALLAQSRTLPSAAQVAAPTVTLVVPPPAPAAPVVAPAVADLVKDLPTPPPPPAAPAAPAATSGAEQDFLAQFNM
jgi:hypothetical protein